MTSRAAIPVRFPRQRLLAVRPAASTMPLTFGLALFAFLIGVSGCGSKPPDLPTTYPVRGTVVDATGKPISGGAIRLTSTGKDRLEAAGEIGAEGKFELRTIAKGEPLTGAVAGKHQVVVIPAGKPGDIPPAMSLSEVTVEPKDNDLKIALPK